METELMKTISFEGVEFFISRISNNACINGCNIFWISLKVCRNENFKQKLQKQSSDKHEVSTTISIQGRRYEGERESMLKMANPFAQPTFSIQSPSFPLPLNLSSASNTFHITQPFPIYLQFKTSSVCCDRARWNHY